MSSKPSVERANLLEARRRNDGEENVLIFILKI